jgi:UTP--glucose-1-phosphate uridylyltransferase
MTRAPSSVKTAVVAAAGVATRMWPTSKAVPKELFPLGRLPVIAHLLIEFYDAGVERVVLVVGSMATPIFAVLDPRSEPPPKLRDDPDVQKFQEVIETLEIVFIRQLGPYGNGAPVASALAVTGEEPFIYAFSDDVILGNVSRRLGSVYTQARCPCLVVEEVPESRVSAFGIAETAPDPCAPEGVERLVRLIEKPRPEDTPSRLAVPGRYLVTPDLARLVGQTPSGRAGELWFTDAIQAYLDQGGLVYTVATRPGDWATVGDPDNYLRAMTVFNAVHYGPNAGSRA